MKLLIITQKVDASDQLLGFFIDWLKQFSKHFSQIQVLCLEKGQYSLPPNIRVTSLGKDRGVSKIGQLWNFYRMIIGQNDYDAVFVHMSPIWMVLGGWYWRLRGRKAALWYTSKGVTIKLKNAEKWADVIFTASAESFRLDSSKVIVTGHGIDTELFKPNLSAKFSIPNSKIKILSVGRISAIKNYGILVEAVNILKEKGKDVLATMVGEPALEKDIKYEVDLKNTIKALDLESNFEFIGKISHQNLPEIYNKNDIFIHLSNTGSLDKTVLEAMACGLKVISSNDASKTFLPAELFLEKQDPELLAEKIIKAIESEYNLRPYVVENHSLANLIERISKYIKA